MLGADIFSLILVILFASLLAYRMSIFKEKEMWHFSLLQILYLVIMPGFLFVVLFSYLQTILARPLIEKPFLSDKLLVTLVLLSMLFAYGGKAIHSVTKMLSETALRQDDSEVGMLNKYFHLKFSHSLMYAAGMFVVIGLTLLELNHLPLGGYDGWFSPIVRGLVGGVIFIVSMYHYTHSHDDYVGRWADLKAVFLLIWLGLVLILYSIWKADQTIRAYQLVIPVLSAVLLILVLNIGLVIRHMRRSGESLGALVKGLVGRSKSV